MTSDRSDAPDGAQADAGALLECVRAYVQFQLASGIDGLPLRAADAETGAAAGARAAGVTPQAQGATIEADGGRQRSGGATPDIPLENSPGPRDGATRLLRPSGKPRDSAHAEEPRSGGPASPSGLAAAASLDDVRAVLGDCQRCKLCSGRTHIVFGVGDPDADLMFIGEGPGSDEDRRGEPFVGRAGQLLTDIITKGMRLRREDVYIANVVKCRPPENRDPEPDEIAACRPFLQRQVELVRPKVLVALGRVATQALLGVTTPIGRLRGQWHEYAGIKLMPTLHPAYLLRNPSDKRLVWNDIQMVMGALGIEAP